MSSTENGYVHSVDFNTREVQGEPLKVMNARVLFQRSRFNEETNEYDDTGSVWADLSIWGKRAEALESILKPGASIMATGIFYQRKWQHKETGEDQYGMGFRADGIAILPRCIQNITFKPRKPGESNVSQDSGVEE